MPRRMWAGVGDWDYIIDRVKGEGRAGKDNCD